MFLETDKMSRILRNHRSSCCYQKYIVWSPRKPSGWYCCDFTAREFMLRELKFEPLSSWLGVGLGCESTTLPLSSSVPGTPSFGATHAFMQTSFKGRLGSGSCFWMGIQEPWLVSLLLWKLMVMMRKRKNGERAEIGRLRTEILCPFETSAWGVRDRTSLWEMAQS